MVDLLVAPLGPGELMAGFIGGAMVRGLMVGGLTWVVAALFTGFSLEHPLVTLVFLLLSSYVFSVLGMLAAVWAEKFEQINFFPTFVMLPLTFLGGVFYSVRELPSPWNRSASSTPWSTWWRACATGCWAAASSPPALRRRHPRSGWPLVATGVPTSRCAPATR